MKKLRNTNNNKVNLLVDHQSFSLQNYGGITTYFVGLLNDFNLLKLNFKLSVLVSSNQFVNLFKKQIYFRFSDWTVRRLMKYIYFTINSLYTLFILKTNKINIYHATYFEDFYLKFIKNISLVITIYDCSYEELGSSEKWFKRVIEKRKKVIKRADAIIAISESVKQDILKYYNIDETKITVIPLFSPITKNNAKYKSAYSLAGKNRYILFIGTRSFNKNFDRFIEAYTKISVSNPNIKLICAGGGKFTPLELEMINKLGIEKNVIYKDYKVDSDLIPYYKGAEVFVFPTLKEGFGIPLLGSFACGCPVIASDIQVFKEVAGGAYIKCNPNSVESITSAIESVIEKRVDLKSFINKGYFFSKEYTSIKMTERTIKLYKSIINS